MRLYTLLQTIRALLVVITALAGFNVILLLASLDTPTEPVAITPTHIAQKEPEAETVATTTQEVALPDAEPKEAEKPEPVITKKETPVASKPQAEPTVTQQPTPSFLSIDQVSPGVRASVVNIICNANGGGAFHPISGSGIIVDSRGVILTNAHVAQYFLLEQEVSCVIRTGSPAKAAYEAELLFLPPGWIEQNAAKITEASPSGTGEHDYAFLRITKSVRADTPLPETFPFTPIAVRNSFDSLNKTLVVAYPSELVGAIATQLNLFQVSTTATIDRAYFFSDPVEGKEPNVDVISIGGSIVAQGGSSGGAIVDLSDGGLVGIIVTSTRAATTEEKDLRGVTTAHINRSLLEHLNLSLPLFLQDDLSVTAEWFRNNYFTDERSALIENILAS